LFGGTGLYIDCLINGIEFEEEQIDEEYREELNNIAEAQGLEKLYEMAEKIDPEAMKKVSQNDKKRIIRVLEIHHKTGKTKTEQEKDSRKGEVKYDYKLFALTNPDREKIYETINKRLDLMMKQGLIQEVEELLRKYENFPTSMQALGYKEVVEYLQGGTTEEEMIEKIKTGTRRYAKRQITWFKKYKDRYNLVR